MAARPPPPSPSLDRVEMGLRYKRLREELRACGEDIDSARIMAIRAELEQLSRDIDTEDRRRSSLSNLCRAPLTMLTRE